METNQTTVESQQPAATERSKAYEIARTAALAALGLGVVTVEAITTLVERLVARAEQARADARTRSDAVEQDPADVNVLQSRVEQLKAELESLRTRQAPEEGLQQ